MGSPVLFRQQRAGRDGATFELVKFRTMRTAEPGDDGPDTDEDRLTRLGQAAAGHAASTSCRRW